MSWREPYYVLGSDGRTPVPCDMWTWGAAAENRRNYERDPWCVGQTKWADGAALSTVFLGLDHQWGDEGPPILFETMLFDDDEDDYQTRCSTWDEALVMHRAGVLWAVENGHGQPISSILVGVL